jgi:hypothetical protein
MHTSSTKRTAAMQALRAVAAVVQHAIFESKRLPSFKGSDGKAGAYLREFEGTLLR